MKIRDWRTKDPAHVTSDNELLVKIGSPIESNGGIPVNLQDQTTPPIDLFFLRILGAFTTLAIDAEIGDQIITVTDDSGLVVGKTLGLFSATGNRFYFGIVLDISSDGVELDSPLDFAFQVGDNIAPLSKDMNVDGSSTPQLFQIRGGGPTSTIEIDITRIIIQMTTTDIPEFIEFGDLTALTKGIVLSRNNGIINNIFNAKTNADLANLMYDLAVIEEAKAFNTNGIVGRMTFAGQDKHGVAIRLQPGDTLDLLIQDNLSGLLSFRIMAQGHVVTD